MTEQDKEIAIQTVKDILHILHEKRYEDLPSCVDEMEWDDMAEAGQQKSDDIEHLSKNKKELILGLSWYIFCFMLSYIQWQSTRLILLKKHKNYLQNSYQELFSHL